MRKRIAVITGSVFLSLSLVLAMPISVNAKIKNENRIRGYIKNECDYYTAGLHANEYLTMFNHDKFIQHLEKESNEFDKEYDKKHNKGKSNRYDHDDDDFYEKYDDSKSSMKKLPGSLNTCKGNAAYLKTIKKHMKIKKTEKAEFNRQMNEIAKTIMLNCKANSFASI